MNSKSCEIAFLKFASDFIKHPQFERLSENAKEVFLKTAKTSFHSGWIACALEKTRTDQSAQGDE